MTIKTAEQVLADHHAAIDGEPEKAERVCEWRRWALPNGGFIYESDCGETHQFVSSGPKENGARWWCFYCGGKLVVVK